MTKIEFFPNFHKKFKKLNKKNRNLLKDIQELVKVLEQDPKIGVFFR